MLARLPSRYRFTIWVAGLLTFAGMGAWLAFTTRVPLIWSAGAALGTLLGVLAVQQFLHQLETGSGQPRTARAISRP